MNPPAVDMHCHLDLYPDHAAAFRFCRERGVEVLAVTTTPHAWAHNAELAGSSGSIRVGLGLHPQVVAERETDVGLFEALVAQAKFIGEVGLDAGPRHYRSLDAQRRVFARILEMSVRSGRKAFSIHAVRTVSAVLDMFSEHVPRESGLPVFHWFSGSLSEAARAIKMDSWFSINAEMAKSPSGRKIIDLVPLNRMLTETDGPFVRDPLGNPVQPGAVDAAVSAIAAAKHVPKEQVRQMILENLSRLDDFVGHEASAKKGERPAHTHQR
jgi:TatD DNase family protein